jgi:hypothetical protein
LLDGVGNFSAYVDALVLAHGREWTEALAMLVDYGWRPPELVAVCRALSGYGLSIGGRQGAWLATELRRMQERDKIFSERGVETRRWQNRLAQLSTDPAVAWAIAVLAREYALPNQSCRDAVRGGREHEVAD